MRDTQQISLLDDQASLPARHKPDRPIIRQVTDIEGDPPLRLAQRKIWVPKRKTLCWVLYRPLPGKDIATERITGWTYQLGYGGILVVSLYPLMTELRATVSGWRLDSENIAYRALAARTAGQECHRFAVGKIVLATGHLDHIAEGHLHDWLEIFRHHYTRGGLWSIGTTPDGWPMAPAISGRTPPPETVTLQRWRFPSQPKPRFMLTRVAAPDLTEAG